MTQKTNQNPWNMDVRVRERNLKAGVLTDKDVEKHLAALPDLADQSEAFGTSQPALAQPPPQPHHAPVEAAPESDVGDDGDDADDADDADGAAEDAEGEGTP